MNKTEKVTVLSTIILVGFVFAVIYHYILGFYLHFGSPFNSFVYPASFAFCDLFRILPYIKDFKPYQENTLWVVYFPLTYLLMLPFAFIKNKILAYLLYISPFFYYLTKMNVKTFTCDNLTKLQNFQNIFIITFISYPVLYSLDKGNFDMILFVMLGVWVYLFPKEKYGICSVLLAIMNAIKPFTVWFLFLFLFKKKYKEFFLSIILTAFLIIGGFLTFPDNIFYQIIVLLENIALYKITYALGTTMGLGFCSSIFIPLKILFMHFSTNLYSVIKFVNFYDYFCHFITAVTIFFVWREKTYWKQILLLIGNFLLLPYCTYDYKLIFLFIPLWMFIDKPENAKSDLIYTLLFGLLFIPKNIIIKLVGIHNNVSDWTSLSVLVNPILIVLLCLLVIYEQFKIPAKKIEESN